jgi:hypothetical protein
MRIKYLSGPKSGQFDHVPNSQEFQVLASAGLIEILPYKDFRERLKDEMAAMPKPVVTVSWGVRHCMQPGNPRSVILIKTVNASGRCDETTYDAPPADCPPAIVAKFRKEVAVYEQIRQDKIHAERVQAAKEGVAPRR